MILLELFLYQVHNFEPLFFKKGIYIQKKYMYRNLKLTASLIIDMQYSWEEYHNRQCLQNVLFFMFDSWMGPLLNSITPDGRRWMRSMMSECAQKMPKTLELLCQFERFNDLWCYSRPRPDQEGNGGLRRTRTVEVHFWDASAHQTCLCKRTRDGITPEEVGPLRKG